MTSGNVVVRRTEMRLDVLEAPEWMEISLAAVVGAAQGLRLEGEVFCIGVPDEVRYRISYFKRDSLTFVCRRVPKFSAHPDLSGRSAVTE